MESKTRTDSYLYRYTANSAIYSLTITKTRIKKPNAMRETTI
jgi:hypothetical protein